MDEPNAAQAVQLIRALRNQLHEMTRQLGRLECQRVADMHGRTSAIRGEVTALRRDVRQAQIFIDRLERRYLNGDGHAQPRQSAQPRRSTRQGGLQPRSEGTAIRW